jgi:hypothetical protein
VSNIAVGQWVKIQGSTTGKMISPLDTSGPVDAIWIPNNSICHFDYEVTGSDYWIVAGYHTLTVPD